nr:hypothetical protein [Tanacetum cinerariifolium]
MGIVWETLAEETEGVPHLGPTRPRVYSDLSPEEKDRYNSNIMVTNILLQGLPKDINTLINHYTDAKDIWDNVKMLLEVVCLSEATRAHANENKMMLDRFTQHTVDPLALMSNVSHQQPYSQSSTTPPSAYVPLHLADNAHLDSGLSPTDNLIENLTNTLALLTQSNKAFLPQTNNQLRTLSNTRNQATVQDGRVVFQNVQGQGNNPRGGGTARYEGAHNRVGNANPGQARQIKCYNCNDEEQLLFLAGGQDNAIDEDVDEQPVQDLALNAPTAQTMFMVNLSSADPVYDEANPSYDSDILSEYVKDITVPGNTVVDNSLTAELATCKEQVELYKRQAKFELMKREQKIVEQLRIVITDRNFKEETLKKELHSAKLELASTINHNKLMVEEVKSLKKDFKQKENKYLEDFLDMKSLTPHKQLTPKQIFWSQDLIKMKTKALKEQTTASRPIKALKVYLPNIPATLVPRRITPTGLTEGEKGFEQTKECYLKEVIPFFKILKELFEGIQKALTKEIKEMKDVFEELEAEVSQNVVDRKHDEIKRKNLLIANDNLIAECLSKEVFYVAMNSELNVSRFTKMHVANTIVEARCLELEAEILNLRDKSHNDNHNELVNRFSNLKVKALTTKNVNLKAEILKDHVKPTILAPGKYAIDVEPIPSRLRNNRETHLDYLRHLKESVETIREIVEEAKVIRPSDSLIVSACRYTKHSQELLEYAIGTCPQDSHQRDKKHALAPLIRKKQVTFVEQCCSKHMTGDRLRLMNFVKKFTKTVRFENDHFGAIIGYGDYMIGDSVISRHSCYVRDTNGVELIKGSHGSNLYTISVEGMIKSSPICLLSKASKNKSWLWHRCLNHLNFGTINDLAQKDLVRGLPRLKFKKDHLCSACQLGKSKKHTHKPKIENTNLEVLNTLHMDLSGPMRVQTINGKKYILVVIDDYSRWSEVVMPSSDPENRTVSNK